MPLRTRLPRHRAYSTTIQAALSRAHSEKSINAFVSLAEGERIPKSHSIQDPSSSKIFNWPVAVKDNICTSDFPTSCSSEMLRDFRPPYDATVVQLLKKKGAFIVGKTNCDEFGMGSMNTYSCHGPVVNPFRPVSKSQPARSAGGSSGGSAAAVAAGMCYAALATDTGGSTRLPASYCGVVGLKPSYGMLSRHGVISFADSLDCVGILADRVSRVQDVFGAISEFDHLDPTSAPIEIRLNAESLTGARIQGLSMEGPLSGLRIGIPQEYFPSELSTAIVDKFHRALSYAHELGATLVPISLPSTKYALSAYYVLASAEASSNLARYDGVRYGKRVEPTSDAKISNTAELYALTRSAAFGDEVQRRILLGSYALTADAFDNYFLQAQRVRNLIRDDFDRVFTIPNVLRHTQTDALQDSQGVDIILHPTAIRAAPLLPSSTSEPSSSTKESGLDAYVQDVLTVPASLAGLPALSIPIGTISDQNSGEGAGWPVGVSIVGQWGSEELVLRAGAALEEGGIAR